MRPSLSSRRVTTISGAAVQSFVVSIRSTGLSTAAPDEIAGQVDVRIEQTSCDAQAMFFHGAKNSVDATVPALPRQVRAKIE